MNLMVFCVKLYVYVISMKASFTLVFTAFAFLCLKYALEKNHFINVFFPVTSSKMLGHVETPQAN